MSFLLKIIETSPKGNNHFLIPFNYYLELLWRLSNAFLTGREFIMGKSNKSKRFIQQSSDSVTKYSEKFPYHFTLAEAEERKAKNKSY